MSLVTALQIEGIKKIGMILMVHGEEKGWFVSSGYDPCVRVDRELMSSNQLIVFMKTHTKLPPFLMMNHKTSYYDV